jgi:peptide/nickel transport system substrate-binding protein
MATAIQANLRAIGMTVQIQTYEWNSYLTKINAGLDDVDLAEMAWMTNDPDTLPFLALRSEAQPPSGFNSGWYSNPEVDELLRHGRRATDAGQRATTYATVQRIVHDEAPWVFVASWKQNVVVNDRVTGMRLEPSFLLYLDEVNKR